MKRVKELFDLADADHGSFALSCSSCFSLPRPKMLDGIITKQEFFRLCQNLHIDVSKKDFEVLFANLDTSNNGKIEFGEFLSGMRWLEVRVPQ